MKTTRKYQYYDLAAEIIKLTENVAKAQVSLDAEINLGSLTEIVANHLMTTYYDGYVDSIKDEK